MSTKNLKILVIDIGGTHFRSSIFRNNELIDKKLQFETPNFLNNPKLKIDDLQNLLILRIKEVVRKYKTLDRNISDVGISFPAPLTAEGVVKQASTVWGKEGKDFPLASILIKSEPKINWTLANDITAAAERYAINSKYNKYDYFSVITVSSGIGGKIYDVKNRSVILDSNGIGGEIGHIKIDFSADAPICDCGARGHLGALSSGRAVERLARAEALKNISAFKKSSLSRLVKTPGGIDNRSLIKAIKTKDSFSLSVLDKAVFPLALSISHISGNIGAEKFIIIGGFALACGDSYLEVLRKNLLKVDFYGREKEEIPALVELGNDDENDPLVGIGILAQRKYEKKNN